jgi:2-methylisocitrate lyase-like PEP mutase family enzyme
MTTPTTTSIEAANSHSRRLRELLHAPEILIMPGAFSVLSALLFQHLGFPAIQGSSAGFANALGYHDLGLGRDRTVEISRLCAEAVTIPVNADGEDGFGGPDDVRVTVRAFVAAGAAGMNMEDGTHDGDKRGLAPVDYQLEKIAAFMDERKALGSEFLLNARVDSFIIMRDDRAAALKDAVARGQAYAAAGADSVFFFGAAEPDEIRTLANEVPAPVSILAGPGVPGPRELQELGVARVSYGSQFLRMAAGAVKRFSEELLQQGTHNSLADAISGGEMKAAIDARRA